MVARPQTSAAGILALLDEPESQFKQHALQTLNPLVPQFWAEISENIASMSVTSTRSTKIFSDHLHSEALYEDTELPKDTRSLAALLASKVYYFLGEYDEALSFALGAGAAFQAEFSAPESQEYIETITCQSNSIRAIE
jgi:26S proteasome regulatory subunit N2